MPPCSCFHGPLHLGVMGGNSRESQEAIRIPEAPEQSGPCGAHFVLPVGSKEGSGRRKGSPLAPEGSYSLCHFLLCPSDLTVVQQGRLGMLWAWDGPCLTGAPNVGWG